MVNFLERNDKFVRNKVQTSHKEMLNLLERNDNYFRNGKFVGKE
jgi:hypothetical protein